MDKNHKQAFTEKERQMANEQVKRCYNEIPISYPTMNKKFKVQQQQMLERLWSKQNSLLVWMYWYRYWKIIWYFLLRVKTGIPYHPVILHAGRYRKHSVSMFISMPIPISISTFMDICVLNPEACTRMFCATGSE